MKLLSDRLRDARLQRGLSQKKLAKASGVSQSAIANYEGNTRKSPKKIFQLAQALKVNARWLATGEGSANDTDYPHSLDASLIISGESGTGAVVGQRRADASWPFQRLSAERIRALTDEEREVIEQTLISLVTSFESRQLKQRKEQQEGGA